MNIIYIYITLLYLITKLNIELEMVNAEVIKK